MRLGLAAFAVLVAALFVWLRRQAMLRRIRDRLDRVGEVEPHTELVAVPASLGEGSWLSRWLFLAGYREPEASARFQKSAALFLALAIALVVGIAWLDPFAPVERSLATLPGGLGGLVVSLLQTLPLAFGAVIAAAPFLQVRAARRARVASVEQDLPTTLELLATLSEAGLGFDSALMRIQEGDRVDRPLAHEFALFRAESLHGVPRVRCLRRLAARLDVAPVSSFVSALVQAEQMGIGLAEVLRRQADDLRSRRREHALLKAQSLPAKLVFPLVICFLPGIFVFTLGPALYSILRLTAGATGGGP